MRKTIGILFECNIQKRSKSMFFKKYRVTILELVQTVGDRREEHGISNQNLLV